MNPVQIRQDRAIHGKPGQVARDREIGKKKMDRPKSRESRVIAMKRASEW